MKPSEVGCDSSRGLRVELGKGELAGAVDGHKEIKLALLDSHLGGFDMEISDKALAKLFLRSLVTLDVGQPANAVQSETTLQH